MNRNYRKGFAFLLALMLVFSLVPGNVAYGIPPGSQIQDSGADPITELPARLTDGAIWTDKSVVDNKDGTFDITLKAIGQSYKLEVPQPRDLVDVVFVLDVSGSMGNNGSPRLANMKTAATNAVNMLLSVEGNRVAIVKYSEMADNVQDFTSSTSAAISKITQFNHGGGTNIQNGFYVAQELIKARSDKSRKPIVVLMSDGRPTYYHNILSGHTSGNRQGNGYTNSTGANHVWNTILQAMELKNQITNAAIYTIGFGVGADPYAIATLMPTEENTNSYRPDIYSYSGVMRDRQRTVTIVYESTSSDWGNTWTQWQPTSNRVEGTSSDTSSWTPFSGYASSPSNYWNDTLIPLDGPRNERFTDYSGQNRRKVADFRFTQTGVRYQNINQISSGKTPFNHKYWENGSTITSDSAAAIFEAFVNVINDIINIKPFSYTTNQSGGRVYSNLTITDELGPQYEIVGSLPAGVSQSGNVLTWTIDGNTFDAMAAGSTTIDMDKLATVSFKVRLKDDAPLGTKHYTNVTAGAVFNVLDENPSYLAAGQQTQSLPNNGWLKLKGQNIDADITITKNVVGPVSNENRTFTFDLYYNEDLTGQKLNATPISITVNGAGSASETYEQTIPYSTFDSNGNLTLWVKENEIAPDSHWTYDLKKSVTINRNSPAGAVSFTNTYAPKGTLTVTKAWGKNAPEVPITFDLQKGVGDGQWQTVSTGHTINSSGQTVVISNLLMDTKYRVVEASMLDYTATYSPEWVEFTGSDNLEQTITITNDYQAPVGRITINKVWDHGNNPIEDRPEEIVFNYTGPENTSGSVILAGSDTAANWSKVFETKIFGTYTFTEVVPQDYTVATNPQNVTISTTPGQRDGSLTFTNTYVEPKGTLTVSKVWANDENDTSFRPATISMVLQKDGSDLETFTLPENDDTPWSRTFENLNFGVYSIKEVTVPDYTTGYSAQSVTLSKHGDNKDIGARTGGIVVTNTFNNPTGQITVTKTWAEGGVTSSAVRPSQITVQIMDGNQAVSSAAISESNNWQHTFTGLPLDGKTYTVVETASGDDLTKLNNYEGSVSYCEGSGGITINTTHRDGQVTILNTYGKGTLTVTKFWEDGGNNDLPSKATITLIKLSKIPKMVWVPVSAPITPSAQEAPASLDEDPDMTDSDIDAAEPEMELVQDGYTVTVEAIQTVDIERPATSHVFYDLEMDDNISYYVYEDTIPFYDTSYSTNKEGGVVLTEKNSNGHIQVTNTYTDPKGQLIVTKIWNHGNNPHPAGKATVILKAGDVEVDRATFQNQHTFSNLTLGAVYTIEEVQLDNYNPPDYGGFISYTPAKGLVNVPPGIAIVTNTYIPETGNLEVIKEWIGNTGSAITITLSRYYENGDGPITDDSFVRTTTLSAVNGWRDTFSGLELYGPGGALYHYTASESGSDLNLYTTVNTETPTLSKEKIASITITNTYTPDKGTLVITKNWLNENGSNITPPVDSIEVVLEINGVAEANSMVLNADNNWTVTRTGLNVDKVYSVKEVSHHEAYGVSYSSNSIKFDAQALNKLIAVTNQRTNDNPDIQITKSAVNTAAVLEDGKAKFDYSIIVKNTGNRTLTDLYIIDEMTVSDGAVNAEIIYSPTPDSIASGKARFDLDGTLAPGAERTFNYSITVDKSGSYHNLATAYGSYGSTKVSDEDDVITNVKAPGLSIIKRVIGPSVKTGSSGTFAYELTIRNDGEFDLYNVTVQDVMTPPAGATMSYSYSGALTYSAIDHTFEIGELQQNAEDVVITYTVAVNSRGTYNNTATVTGHYGDEVYGEGTLTDSDNATVQVVRPSTPNPPSDPNPPVDIPEEPVPAGPTPGDPEDVLIVEDDIPAAPLPKTGGIDGMILYALGAALIGTGLYFRKRVKAK